MATNNRFEIQIAATTDELKKGIQQARKELQSFQKEVNNRKLDGSYKTSMQAERLEGQKLMNQTRAVRLESAKLALEKRKTGQAVQAASGSYREAQQRLTALGKSIRDARGGFTSTSPAIKAQIAEYNNLNNALKKFDAQMGNHYRNVGNYSSALGMLTPQLSMLAGKGGGLLGVALAARNAYQTVGQFDSGLRNVEKTTGLSSNEISKLGKEFVGLSRQLQTVSSNQLTQYATIAGQLGVKGTRDILNFTEALAKLETASNITGEEGGAEIARTLTLVDGGVQNVKQFADEIVNLGNNFAATEKEILANAESIAQNVGIYRIGRQEVLAFATATKSVGIEAELVGSTFNRTLAIFEKAIRTGNGVNTILSLIGGTQEELSARFKADASGVFVDFVGALNRVYKEGGSVNAQLEAIGVNAVRDQRVIQSLAANGYDVLTRALETAKNASGALDAEFETASGKMINQVNRIKISWENLVLSIENSTGAIGAVSVAFADMSASAIEGFNNIITSRSWTEFFARLAELSGNRTLAFAAQGVGNAIRTETEGAQVRNRGLVSYKDMKDFYRLTDEQKKKELVAQELLVNAQAKEYQLNKANLKIRDSLLWNAEKLAKMRADVIQPVGVVLPNGKTVGGGEVGGKGKKTDVSDILGDLRGSDGDFFDQKIAKINNEYDKLVAKIRQSKGSGADISEALNLAGAKRDIESLRVQVDKFLYQTKNPSTGRVTPSGTLYTPNLYIDQQTRDNFASRYKGQAQIYPELSKYVQSTLRRGVSNALMGVFEDIGKLSESNYEIEKKYAELRANASASQITALRKMERLEKQISNGLTNTLTGLISSISSMGARTLSSAVGEGISSGDFSQLSGLFRGKNKAMGYGALASTIGGLVSSMSSKTSTGGQALGGLLSGAGTGAMIGSIIPGIGTAIGAAVGAVVGALGGILGSSKAKKERELQELQLSEQRKQTALMERQNALAYASSIIGQMTNQGIVTSVDRNAYGDLIASVSGDQIQLVLDRSKKQRG